MKNPIDITQTIYTLNELALLAEYSLMRTLHADPESNTEGLEHASRQVFSGHFVPVTPTPIKNPHYLAHSKIFFKELGFADSLAHDEAFMRMFSGDLSDAPTPLSKVGWATGYALSIYGTEYYEQCPFKTGNGYGDGRAVSVFEGIINGKRWEMQLKGGGRTPYCRGADGRAVLRSSIREFLAQEHMYALGIPTSRSLTLYASMAEKVKRPWFNQNSYSRDPEVMIDETVAITTRVAPSFLRVGQIELFGRRARKQEYPKALEELEMIVLHLIDREYSEVIDTRLPLEEKVLLLAIQFQTRLTSLVANWICVGYCQGNFNSDNCAAGGFTLDYGPFGFIDMFDPRYQPWTGGGVHFSFFNQPQAAKRNFDSFCSALKPLLTSNDEVLMQLESIQNDFAGVMQKELEKMWASKLGLARFDETLLRELITLMIETSVDYTLFFRELSQLPEEVSSLVKSFYVDDLDDGKLLGRWQVWLEKWKSELHATTPEARQALSEQMKHINPKYTLREWFLVPAYQHAAKGDYALIAELQEVINAPYDEQSKETEEKYYQKKPTSLFHIAGVSHVSCSS